MADYGEGQQYGGFDQGTVDQISANAVDNASGAGGVMMPTFNFGGAGGGGGLNTGVSSYVPGQGYYNPGSGYNPMSYAGQNGMSYGGGIGYGSPMGAMSSFGGGGGGYGNPALANQLATAYQKSYADAKQANLDRYNQVVVGNQQLQTRGMKDWDQYAGGAQSLVDQQYTSAKQQDQMRLASSGLSNSTVQNQSMVGIDAQRAQQEALLARQKIDVDNQLSQNVLGPIERRVDPYPSADQYMNTMLHLGQMGAFGGAGGSVGVAATNSGVRPAGGGYAGWSGTAAGGSSGGGNSPGYQPYGGYAQLMAGYGR